MLRSHNPVANQQCLHVIPHWLQAFLLMPAWVVSVAKRLSIGKLQCSDSRLASNTTGQFGDSLHGLSGRTQSKTGFLLCV